MKLWKSHLNKKCAPNLLFFNEKKIQKDSDDFWHRKLTLKVKFWYFLTARHYSNFQNLVTSFEYSWFLAKNLSNFVFLLWKLHNRKCHKCMCSVCIRLLAFFIEKNGITFHPQSFTNKTFHIIFFFYKEHPPTVFSRLPYYMAADK